MWFVYGLIAASLVFAIKTTYTTIPGSGKLVLQTILTLDFNIWLNVRNYILAMSFTGFKPILRD
jgi:hypothetical protein